ncbi:AAA family ATPase [Actinoallomurus purpureus]|uniref:AAA family ATPase n=1 Tax=Actinoallomurus purpureus TaxID=478114 RepID=UPI003555E3CE
MRHFSREAAAGTRRTYAELLERAARLLSYGESVIIDASWTSAQHRAEAAHTAEQGHADLVSLRCDTPLAAARLHTRPRGVSDADPAIAAHMAQSADPWPEAIMIDTSGPIETSAEQALSAIRPHGPGHTWQRRPHGPRLTDEVSAGSARPRYSRNTSTCTDRRLPSHHRYGHPLGSLPRISGLPTGIRETRVRKGE